MFEQRYRDLVSDCLNEAREFGITLIRHGREVGGPAEPHTVGTAATIAGYARLPDGRYLLEVEGTRRFRIETTSSNGSYPSAYVTWLSEPIGNFAQAREAGLLVDRLFGVYRVRGGDGDLPVRLLVRIDPQQRRHKVRARDGVDPYEKQKLLEAASASDRLAEEADILRREIAVLDHLKAKRG